VAQSPALSLQDIADLAHVSRPVVSMWRRRPRARGREVRFPRPVTSTGGVERFDRDEIVAWLEQTGRGNNEDARQDAPALAVPDGAELEDVVTLLCLTALTGEELNGLTADQLVALAERADPSDRLLLREVRALAEVPHLLRYVDDLVEGSFGGPDALARAESGRLRREATERGMTEDLAALVRAVARAGRVYLGDVAVGLVPPVDRRLDHRLAEGFAGVLLDGDDASVRARRRRAVIDGVDLLDEAPATVRVVSVIGASEADALEAVDDLVVSLGPRDIGVAVGAAALLCDPLVGDPERRRSQTLRAGRLAMAVRLPRGLWKGAHRQSLGVWILDGGRDASWLLMADLDAEPIDVDDLASDVTAALELTDRRAYRYARRGELPPVLAGGPVVPRGVRAVRLRNTGLTDHLDRVHTASLTTSEPVSAYDVAVAPAPGRIVLRRRSLGELDAAGQIEVRRGSRIDPARTDPNGTVRVLSADGGTDAVRLDPFDARELYPRAARTEPGDVVFVQRPRPAARVDAVGGALVASPSRILRLGPGVSIGPYGLAAIVNELAPETSEWPTWSVPDLPAAEADALEAALVAAADHLAELRRHERAVQDLITSLIEGVAAGAVTIDPTSTRRAG